MTIANECKSLFIPLLVIVMLVSACGGGGGNESATGPGDVDQYFPFSQGNTWFYRGVETTAGLGQTTEYTNTVTVGGTKLINGIVATILATTNQSNIGYAEENYYAKDNNAVMFYGSNDSTDTITPKLVPYREARFPVVVGDSFIQLDKSGMDFGEDQDEDGINEKLSVLSQITVPALETVDVAAGHFPNSIKIVTTTTATITLSKSKTKVIFSGKEERWLAKGVGLVKRVETFAANDITTQNTEELSGYTVAGVNRGISAPFTAARDIASNWEATGRPAVGFDGVNYLLVTATHTMIEGRVTDTFRGTLIAPDGRIVKSFDISGPIFTLGYSNTSAIGFDGTNYLVVCQGENGELLGQRVTPGGVTLDGPYGFIIAAGDTLYGNPALAFDGTNYLVTWQKQAKYPLGTDIYAARVSPGGIVVTPEFALSTAAGNQHNPSIAFDGTNYLVIWEDDRPGGTILESGMNIFGARITPDGTVLDPAGLPISTAVDAQLEPRLVFNGTNFFAVWMDRRNHPGDVFVRPAKQDIYGTRIGRDGALLDGPPENGGVPINLAEVPKRHLAVSTANGELFVTWAVSSFPNFPPAGIYGARVSNDGRVMSGKNTTTGIQISGTPRWASQMVYSVLATGKSNALLVWNNASEISASEISGVMISPFAH